MNPQRRQVLKTGAGLAVLGALTAAGFLKPGEVVAAEWNKAAFGSRNLGDVIRALGGSGASASADIVLGGVEIAENGAVVPISIASRIPKTEAIAVLVEKNPIMLAAVFEIPPGTEPDISLRVKMGQSSNVYALVKANGKFFTASKEIKVTLGGCGG